MRYLYTFLHVHHLHRKKVIFTDYVFHDGRYFFVALSWGVPFSQSLDDSGGEGREEEEDGGTERGREEKEEEEEREREVSTSEEIVMEVEDDVSEREERHMDVSHPSLHTS